MYRDVLDPVVAVRVETVGQHLEQFRNKQWNIISNNGTSYEENKQQNQSPVTASHITQHNNSPCPPPA
jgi:hypothetical protein